MHGLQLAIKRAIDIAVAICLMPLALVVSVLVSLVVQTAYPGRSVLLRQERIGRDCRTFGMYKLRTLPARQSASQPVDTAFLPRRIALIRRLALDELPQILNVLLGQMSLIGNRPLLEAEWYVRFGEAAEVAATMRPGILSHYALEAHSQLDMSHESVEYAYDQKAVRQAIDYVEDWSLRQDFAICREFWRLVKNRFTRHW